MSACREHEADLIALCHETLEPLRRNELLDHVAACPGCRAELAATERVLARLADPRLAIEPRPEATADLRARIDAWFEPASATESGWPGSVASGMAIGVRYLQFALSRSRYARVLGVLAATLLIHAAVITVLYQARVAPYEDLQAMTSGTAMPAPRGETMVLWTPVEPDRALGRRRLDDEDIFFRPEEPDIFADAPPQRSASWTSEEADLLGRNYVPLLQADNSRSIFRLHRLSPATRQAALARLADPQALTAGVDAALDYLAGQVEANGLQGEGEGKGEGASRRGLTALAVLAFLGNGSCDTFGPNQSACGRAVAWLLEQEPSNGAGGPPRAPEALESGLVLWALAENSALSNRRTGADEVERLIVVLEADQSDDGGWPAALGSSEPSDLRTSALVGTALAAAARSGFAVSAEVLDAYGSRYIPATGRLDQELDGVTTATLALSLLLRPQAGGPGAGSDAADLVEAIGGILTRSAGQRRPELPLWERGLLALQLGGDAAGAGYHAIVSKQILAAQSADGSIDPVRVDGGAFGEGRIASTALGALLLEVPWRYRSRS